MTEEQEDHLKWIKNSFLAKVDKKYRAGQNEHGGDLSDKTMINLVDDAISEAIDMVVYLETLRENMVGR